MPRAYYSNYLDLAASSSNDSAFEAESLSAKCVCKSKRRETFTRGIQSKYNRVFQSKFNRVGVLVVLRQGITLSWYDNAILYRAAKPKLEELYTPSALSHNSKL